MKSFLLFSIYLIEFAFIRTITYVNEKEPDTFPVIGVYRS